MAVTMRRIAPSYIAGLMVRSTRLLLFVFSFNATALPPLYIGSTFSPPLSTPDQTGILDKLTHEAFARIGYRAIIVQLPGERSLINANTGIDDGDILRIDEMTDRYPNLIKVPEKMFELEFVAFTKSNTIQIHNWEQLKPYSVALIKGWKILEDGTKGVILTSMVENANSLFNMLQKNRADLALHERYEGEYMIRKLGMKDIRRIEKPLATREMFIYLNKRHSKLIPEVDKALKQLKQDGTYSSILKQGLAQTQ